MLLIEVVVADGFQENQEIAFNTGTHHGLVKMAYKNFDRFVPPALAKAGVRKKVHEDNGRCYYG